jgi:hypothetical protein
MMLAVATKLHSIVLWQSSSRALVEDKIERHLQIGRQRRWILRPNGRWRPRSMRRLGIVKPTGQAMQRGLSVLANSSGSFLGAP